MKLSWSKKSLIVRLFYAICLIAFLVWLIQAIKKYQSMSTSSKISFKYGDDGNKLVRFPSVTICQANFDNDENIVWKNVRPCKKVIDGPPCFLTYIGSYHLWLSTCKKLVKSNKSKQFFWWNCIFGSFPSSKIDFFHILNCKTWNLV